MEELLKTLLNSPEGIAEIVAMYKPVIYAACKEVFGFYEDLVNNDDFYRVQATDSRKMLDALLNEGFSREEAMNIMLANKIGMQSTMNKVASSNKK